MSNEEGHELPAPHTVDAVGLLRPRLDSDIPVKFLMLKKESFLRLKEYYAEWHHRSEQLILAIEPLVLRAIEAVRCTKASDLEIYRIFKERVKLDNEYSNGIRQIVTNVKYFNLFQSGVTNDLAAESVSRTLLTDVIIPVVSVDGQPTTGNTDITAAGDTMEESTTTVGESKSEPISTGPTITENQEIERTSSIPTVSTMPSTISESFLKLNGHSLSRALSQMQLREAKIYEGHVEFIESSILSGVLLKTKENYETLSTKFIQKMKDSRMKTFAANKEVVKSWSEYEKAYRQREKAQTSQKVDKTVREPRDFWLYEQRFIHTALQCRQAQKVFLQTSALSIYELKKLESWRFNNVKNVLKLYVSRKRDMLKSLASVAGSADAMIDPEGYVTAGAEFFTRLRSKNNFDDSHLETGANSQSDSRRPSCFVSQSIRSVELQSQPDATTNTVCEGPIVESTEKTMEGGTVLSESIESQVNWFCEVSGIIRTSDTNGEDNTDMLSRLVSSPTIFNAAEAVSMALPPSSNLFIKRGAVQRPQGYYSWNVKWSSGILVLTWDRFAHMFRSFDDSTPIWTCCLNYVELRKINDKGGTVTLEIREKKTANFFSASKSYYIRGFSSSDLDDWQHCLSIACQADDDNFAAFSVQRMYNEMESSTPRSQIGFTTSSALESSPSSYNKMTDDPLVNNAVYESVTQLEMSRACGIDNGVKRKPFNLNTSDVQESLHEEIPLYANDDEDDEESILDYSDFVADVSSDID